MKSLRLALFSLLPFVGYPMESLVDIRLLEFNAPASEIPWRVVNDNVMGGRSKGGFVINNGTLIFSGTTNTNGGGFSSIRTEQKDWEASKSDGLVVRVRGDQRTYLADLRMKGKQQWMPIAYRAEIAGTQGGEWTTVRIPFSNFKPTRYGQKVPGAPIEGKDIGSIGFMIYDKLDGDFALEVDWIGVYSIIE